MKTYSMYELTGSGACARRRAFPYIFTSREDHVKRAAAIKEAVKGVLFKKIDANDAKTYLASVFADLSYDSEDQRKIQTNDAVRQAMRLALSEKRDVFPCRHADAAVPGLPADAVIRIAPDYGVSYAEPITKSRKKGASIEPIKVIEVVRLKCRKPGSSKMDKKKYVSENLELHVLRKYARRFVKPGETVRLKASIYFLRLATDRFSVEEEAFDADFFNAKGGGNIITLSEDYEKPVTEAPGEEHATELDEVMERLVQSFADGTPADECTEEDCRNCDLNPVCNYHKPPLPQKDAPVSREVKAARFTPEQKMAKEYDSGVCRINAGAGSGKTFVTAHRVVSLLNKGVKPEEIFCTTFTNAAGKELRDRIMLYAEDDGIADEVDVRKIRVQTFNAFGDSIIREEYGRFGFKEQPVLVDDVEKFGIVARLLNETHVDGLDYRNFDSNSSFVKGAVAMGAKILEVWKKHPELSLADSSVVYVLLGASARFCTLAAVEGMYALYADYDRMLRERSLIEYADQEGLLFELLEDEPYYFEKFGFKHVIVDEFQDSTENQIRLIRHMMDAPSFESLMVIGDDSQAIYSFRDTTPEFMIDFEKVIGTKVDDIRLLQNHRSTPEILGFANRINSLNEHRVIKDLIPTRPHGAPVIVKGFFEKEDELAYVGDTVERFIIEGHKPEDIAVLARTKTELEAVGDMLHTRGIPAVVQFPEPVLEDSAVIAACAMADAILNPDDSTAVLVYANAVAGGGLAAADGETVAKAVEEAEVRLRAYRAVEDRGEKMEALTELLTELDPPDDEFPEGRDLLYASFREKALARPVEMVLDYIRNFKKYGQTVEVRRAGKYPGVVLSTAHSSKGLEWPCVVNMVGKYDKPSLHTSGAKAADAVEEERRLLFVSSTRARDELVLTAQYIAFGNAKDGYTPNRFLAESMEAAGEPVTVEHILTMKAEHDLGKKAKRAQVNAQ